MAATSHEDLRTLEALDEVECRYLLRWEVVGRIAFLDEHEAPAVLPVNYVVADEAVLFRTEPELAERLRDRPISFQVDRVDDFRRVGWSVLVRGRAEVVDGPDVDIATWAPGDRRVLVRVVAATITGRRLEVSLAALDERGYL
jgi:nitroimidazol reductase NimA-like FMN-containing flavoprotein (pyridoxamine 5'-phosphate oxidase superfamily)